MKNLILLLASVALLSACGSPKADGLSAAALVETPPFLKKTLAVKDSLRYHRAVADTLEKALLRGRFNGAILVAKSGVVVYEKYVGLRDARLKNEDTITAATPFQIASSGKTMTAAAVLKLWEYGKLDLDDDVSKYFPGFPYPGVTVKTLLNHRSGLPNYLYYLEQAKWPRAQQLSNGEVLNTLMTMKPAKAANPDKRFQYCNTNYVLLALIVEKVSEMSFPDFMKKTFFEPLGMVHSFVIGPNEQNGHLQSFQPNTALWSLDFSDGPYGDKNIYSTPRDMLIWDRALTDGLVLNDSTLEAAYAPYSNEKPGVRNYGLGWRMLNFPNGKKIIFHNGHWHGFNVAFSRLPDEDATIVIISNKYNQSVYSAAKRLYGVFGDYNGKHVEGEE